MPDPSEDAFALTPSSPMVTTVDARPQPTDDKSQERLDALYGQRDRVIERAERSMADESRIREEKASALGPVRQRMADIAAQPLPQPPQTEKPPATPKRSDQHDDETWLMASGLLGALAGAFTRRHQTNALAAFTGAMEGYNEGSRQKFDQNMKIFEAENKSAMERNQQATDHYRSILENRKLSREQVAIELEMAAAQYDDKAMTAAAQTKSELVMANLLDKQIDAAGRMKTSADNLTLKYQQMQQKERFELLKAEMRAIGVNDPAKFQATIDAIGRGDAAPIRGRAGTAIMQEVYSQYAGQDEAHPAYTEGRYLEKRLRAQIPARVEAAAETSAARTQAVREAQLDLIIRSAKPSIQKAADASQNVPRTTFEHLNELFQMAESEIGDPALKVFKLANQQVAEQWAKAMNPTGTMAVAYFNVAQEKLQTSNNPESYMAALKFLDGWLDQELVAAKNKTPMTIQWPGDPAHSTTIQQLPGEIQKKERDLRERTGIDPGNNKYFDKGEFQPRELLPDWLKTPEWLRNKVYTPPSQRPKQQSMNIGLDGWDVEQVG